MYSGVSVDVVCSDVVLDVLHSGLGFGMGMRSSVSPNVMGSDTGSVVGHGLGIQLWRGSGEGSSAMGSDTGSVVGLYVVGSDFGSCVAPLRVRL